MSDVNPANAADYALYRSACNEYLAGATPKARCDAAARAAYHAPLDSLATSWELRASRERIAVDGRSRDNGGDK